MLEVNTDAMVRTVLRARGLKKHFDGRHTLLGKSHTVVRAVDGVDFEVEAGRTLAIVGESGSGKTTTARLVLGLETPSEGTIDFDESEADGPARVQAVFQDPYGSLNPRMRVADIVSEPIGRVRDRLDKVHEAIRHVGLDPSVSERYPHMFSGGQRQRIAIARAIVSRPKLIVLDEPVSALDVSIRAQILNLLKDFQAELGLSYLMISHDLATVRFISDHVAVMFRGRFVEAGDAEHVLGAPAHPYTRALIAAAKPWVAAAPDKIVSGEPLETGEVPVGCPLQNTCPLAIGVCRTDDPPLADFDGRKVACHQAGAA